MCTVHSGSSSVGIYTCSNIYLVQTLPMIELYLLFWFSFSQVINTPMMTIYVLVLYVIIDYLTVLFIPMRKSLALLLLLLYMYIEH